MQTCDPVPTTKNTVTFGKARFVLLSDRMLRLEWAADGKFEDRATLAVVNRAMPPVPFSRAVKGNTLHLATSGFDLAYTDDGKPFSARSLSVRFSLNGKTVAWKPGMRDRLNLGATLRTLDGVKGDKQAIAGKPDPKTGKRTITWKPVNLGSGFISRSGWALVDDSASVLMTSKPEWAAPRPAGNRRDWYLLLHGHDYEAALADAALVFGRQPMPPRFAFGYWWSRYWAYTDRELEHLVEQFDTHRVPLDVMVIDMDWHLEGWTGYTWDRRYFPAPEEFLRWLKARDLKITLNLHPAEGVGRHEEQFRAMAAAMGLDPGKARRVPFDITDPRYMKAYFKLLHHPHERAGVDFWWIDWQQGESTKMRGLDTLPWINHLHWRDMERNPRRAGRRPLILSRFGGIGSGRYCVGFSGDTYSEWTSLRFQPRFTATAANALYGYWSHDIGGHMPGEIEPELYTRWIQFGVYSPVLRTHTTKNPRAERRVWEYPDPYSGLMMDAIRRRYELVPYIYTESRRCYDTGLSLCRPMYYACPGEKAAYAAGDQYMFGSQMLVAPALSRAAAEDEMAEVRVWLPGGQWFDTARGCMEKGGRVIRRPYLVSETPVFVRPGAVIPGQRAPLRLVPGSYPELLITAYPGGNGEYRLYEDDGVSQDYIRDRCAWIPIEQREASGKRLVTIGPAEGRFAGFQRHRAVEIRLPGTVPPAGVRVGGRALPWLFRLKQTGWTYHCASATTIIRLPDVDLARRTVVTVAPPAVPAAMADGLKGLFARLERINYYNTLATHCLVLHPRERLGVDAAQAANRISRRPQTFAAEVKRLRRLVRALPAMLNKLADATNKWARVPNPQRRAYCEKAIAILRRISSLE